MATAFDSQSGQVRRPAAVVPVEVRTQVLVCGGGPAGTAAALAAARQGAQVTLVERYNHLGGLATGGLVLVLPHFVDDGRPTIGGLGLEMRDALAASGEATFRPRSGDSCFFDPEALKVLSLQLCQQAGVEVLHHCWLSDAIVNEGRCCGAVMETKAGPWAALADVVIDATGDGDIYAWAGAEFEKSDQAIGLPYRVGGLDNERWMAWVAENPEASRAVWDQVKAEIGWPDAMFYVSPITGHNDLAWGNNYYREDDGLNPRVLSDIEVNARQKIAHSVRWLRGQLPGWENAWLIDIACQLGVRRSRRLQGVYTLTGEDTSQVDFRHPEAIGRGNDFRQAGLVYDIPYGSLVPASLDGLLTCGRCLSCTHEALEPIREIHVCWVSGEGAGLAAGLAVAQGVAPRDVPVAELQQRLRAANVAFAQDPPGLDSGPQGS